jgi:glycosyl transferase family 25
MATSTLIRVVSLVTDRERREQFAERARGSAVEWAFFDAHTSLEEPLIYDARLTALRRGRQLSAGELGCYSSHYAVWKAFVASSYDQLIVMEDDAWVDWDFLERVAHHDIGSNGIDYLKLSCLNLPPRILKGKLLGRYVAHFLGYPQGCTGYVLTQKGAQQLLQHCKIVAGPIDIVIDQTWWGGMPALCMFPCPVVEKSGPSRIGGDRNKPDLKVSAELRWPRQSMRIQEKVRLLSYIALARLGIVGPRVKLDRRWM